jgi:spermidine/putrescine transport system ATP-binding protein
MSGDLSGDSAPALSVERVGKRYGDVVALEQVSFEVGRGEFFSLLGPSGCGKTTMLRLIAGFEEPASGVLRLGGADLAGVPPYRRHVNTVFQSYALFPHLSVFDNVAFGPRTRRLERPELERCVREMLEVVRLGELASRRPSQLSGGQRQRVALARALVNGPRALLLDEPLSALDPALRREMQAELKRIQRDLGIAFLLVTHDQEEALTLSDRIGVMSRGRLEQVGTPEQVYGEPASAFVARFLGAANLIPVVVEQVDTGRATLRLPGGRVGEAATGGRRFSPGAPALLMIRPEHLLVGQAEPPPGRLGLPVTCTDSIFQGAVRRLVLRAAGGGEPIDSLEAVCPQRTVVPGAALWASWEPQAARLLAPEGDEKARGTLQ